MPDGVLQWFDPASGRAAVARGDHVYASSSRDSEPVGRHPGDHVHFDIRRHDGSWAVDARLRPGNRVSHHQRRYGQLGGYLEASPMFGITRDPEIRGGDGTVLVRWRAAAEAGVDVRARVAYDLITEQRVDVPVPEARTAQVEGGGRSRAIEERQKGA